MKLRIPGPQALEPGLRALGFQPRTPAQAEESVLWDRGRELLDQGCALRVRRYGGATLLTFKGARQPHPTLKIRPEFETAVEDGEALEAILQALGFRPVLRMVKTRAVWDREELVACLDETPFGNFLELEGEPRAIHLAMEALGLGPDRIETRSYAALFSEVPQG
ncbi:MAG: class IV adenylate cyclase [Acidobacteria bacterium]|nr:class IV adenylate cyclase [Acidobacteriota bacterium]